MEIRERIGNVPGTPELYARQGGTFPYMSEPDFPEPERVREEIIGALMHTHPFLKPFIIKLMKTEASFRLKNLIIVIVAVVVVLLLVFFGWNRFRVKKQNILIKSVAEQTEVPRALADIVSFNRVRPYNITSRQLSDGGTQDIASFDTSHVDENYALLKNSLIRDMSFNMVRDVRTSRGFTLEFKKGKQTLDVVAMATPNAGTSTVTFSLYSSL